MSTMAFSIASFMTEVSSRGVLRPNQFVVTMGIPRCMSVTPDENKVLTMRCESASIPDVALATQEIMRYGYGPLESTPYTAVFSGVNLTFVLDKTSLIYRYFNRWMQSIVNFNLEGGSLNDTFTSTGIARNTLNAYEVGYKDDYTTGVNITVFDEQTRPRIQTTLHSAYPKAISAIDLNWGSTDVVRMNVAMAFREYHTNTSRVIPSPVITPEVEAATNRSIALLVNRQRNDTYTANA
jgi:hypothetical protein